MDRFVAWAGHDAEGNAVAGRVAVRRKGRTLSGVVSLPRLDVAKGETVVFDPAVSTTVTLSGNAVVLGTLRMRPNAGVTHTLRFAGVNEANYVGGGMVVLDSDVGLWLGHDSGNLDAAGAVKVPWARAAGGIVKGATSVTLDRDPTGWLVGDELTITATEATSIGTAFSWHYDNLTVAAISGRTVTLSGPTVYPHPSSSAPDGRVFTAEVLNLSRSVRIEGTPTGRAHIMFLPCDCPPGQTCPATPQTISHVDIRYMGPRQPTGEADFTETVLGRYGLHFHMTEDALRGTLVEGVVVRDCGGHSFVPHIAHGITFRGCISHNSYSDSFWWDSASSTTLPAPETHDSLWENCVASLALVYPYHRGFRLTGFALGPGNGNVARNCVAVGIQGGPGDSSGFNWPEVSNAGTWGFTGCVAHNNNNHGIFTWQNTMKLHEISGFAAYNCPGAGISHGAYANRYAYRDSTIWRCGNPVLIHASGAYGTPLTFAGLKLDASGGAHAVHVTKHQSVPEQPTLISGCDLRGYTVAAVGFTYDGSNGASTREWFELDDNTYLSGLPHVKFNPATVAGSSVVERQLGQTVATWTV